MTFQDIVLGLTIEISFLLAGFLFAIGVAVASRMLPVKTKHEITYNNLDKPNSHD